MKTNCVSITLRLLIAAGFVTVATSCLDNFEEYNHNPNETTDEELQRDNYNVGSKLLQLQNEVVPTEEHLYQFTEILAGDAFGGYAESTSDSWETKYSTFNPSADWLKAPFVDVMTDTYPPYRGIRKATTDPVPLALADLLRVAIMHRVTDQYGPIPYSKIVEDKKEQLTVPYDTQQEVYAKMFEELDAAIAVLNDNLSLSTEAFGDYDQVYGGNISKWVLFANSLKLRMAMRLTYVDEAQAKTKALEAINGGVIESNADNAKFQPTLNRCAMIWNDWQDHVISADLDSYMNGYNDPRREAYFLKSVWEGLDYCGLRRGWTTFDKTWGFNFSGVNIKANDPLIWMTASEVAFLRAEGVAIHGWNMGGGSAESYYNEGIRLSFEQWGASGAEAYMADNTSMPSAYTDPSEQNPWNGSLSSITIKWEEGASRETKLERIITQKWIALYYNGNEAWAELRRTGYPKLIPVAYNGSGGVVDSNLGPQRMPYPQEEYTNNSYNVTQAVNTLLNGPDNMGTKVWWARGNR